MLRDELLRSKNDEIARCLQSRKRKLSELYFATVGCLGAIDGAITDTLYEQKKQAFLDANDLSKGRFYNEATLPPFPNYADIVTRVQAHAPPGAGEVATLDVSSEEQERIPESSIPGVVKEKGHVQDKSIEVQKPDARAEIEQPIVESTTSKPLITQRSNIPAPSTSSISTKPHFSTPGTPVSTHENAVSSTFTSPSHTRPSPKDKAIEPSSETVISAPPQHTEASLQSKQGRRLSLAVGTTAHLDQPLSPASSIEPYSTNTPAPPAASPDTSPDESGEIEDHATLSAKPVVNAHATPSDKALDVTTSLTPDEQLRFEEAQSLRRNAQLLAASKAIGDHGEPGPNPVSNQIVKEDVTPSQLVPPPTDQPKTQDAQPSRTGQEEKLSPTSSAVPESQAARGMPSGPAPTELKMEQETAAATKRLSSTSTTNVVVQPIPERMTTRVSSGAIRHKSVSEILGEIPKSGQLERQLSGAARDSSAPRSPISQGSPASVARVKQKKDQEKERTKLSTVVFPKKQIEKNDSLVLIRQQAGDLIAGLNEQQDYLFTLFQNKAYSPPRTSNISTLLATAHKTLSTANHLLEYQEQMDCRTLRRIYALQNSNRWPLRQMQRSAEPLRQGTHWDVLLDHMKWMRTDFREERKWKIAAAKSCAEWCAEYVQSEPEHRAQLRVRTKTPSPKSVGRSDATNTNSDPMMVDNPVDISCPVSQPTPDLIHSTEEESSSEGFLDEPRPDFRDTVAPAAIFSLGSEEFNFSIDFTPVSEKLLGELPIYAPIGISPDNQLPIFRFQADTDWKTEVLPVSKFSTGRITFRDVGPARKKSRYDYALEDDHMETPTVDITPEQTDVALFRPENKHIRDRIHPGHSFRPPTEYPMPSVGFFESRQSSQWTLNEDDELRRLVKDYSYNWSLIASCLSSPSLFSSGAERRTPWECFERWVGLEGLPADMSKTQYFRAYHQRLEAAQRTIIAQQQAAQQQQQQQQAQQGIPGPAQPLVRRRTTQPVRVDRRRASRHLALLDAMRKLAKKRETMLQKQQQASHLASLRKVNEANQPKPPITNPADFSKLKYEREQKLQERQEQYRQQMIAQQRANLAAQRAGQLPNQQAATMAGVVARTPNGVQPAGSQPVPGAAQNAVVNGMPPNANINHGNAMPMQSLPNGRPMSSPMPPNAMSVKIVPQQGMPQQMVARSGIPIQGSPDNARVIREASRLQEQQRLLQSRQQQNQQVPQAGQQQFHNPQQFGQQGSPNISVQGINGNPNNAAMLAAMQAAGGMGSSSPYNNAQGVPTASPRMGQPNHLSSGVVPTITNIQNQIQRSHPNLSPEQVAKLATERLHVYQQQQQRMTQAAMNAAVGNVGSIPANFHMTPDPNFQGSPQANGNVGMQNSQAQFSPMMRVAQPNQQNRVPVTSSPSMNGSVLPQQSRSATPQTQRSGSLQTPIPGANQSPHPPAAQMATN
ncbi:MYB and HSA domain protein [Talaromyces stipitatus ATCC 10500]|uniref:Vacuolar import and degradation protein 21 n=1 Tax=Talaromyces stipitatus (strain ATCC 10500 / CBS 375.48 / QM 6759 / NRRL 1006) TaxID=441959 RepID=B8MKA6_TALSN|nr:MYB and HSA domain protein [Talaromyces stipitatus ATCC 10500]EED15261.1 MYB and HSA domain protein [Talaromyces stipitatus ATCC 10500]